MWGLACVRVQMRQRAQRVEEMARVAALPFAAEAPDLDASLREQVLALDHLPSCTSPCMTGSS